MAKNQHSIVVSLSTSAAASRLPPPKGKRDIRHHPYTIGGEDGEEAAKEFLEKLMLRHPTEHGGKMASLIVDSLGLQRDDDPEATYRRGWLVGLCFALECRLYEDGKAALRTQSKPRATLIGMEELLRLARVQAEEANRPESLSA